MAHIEDYYHEQFLQFLEELCCHIEIVGGNEGSGNPQIIRNKTLEEVYKEVRSKGIIIGFRNLRMRTKYQLSNQMKAEVLYEDREDKTD